MPVRFKSSREFDYPVSVDSPGQSGEADTFTARFVEVSTRDLKNLMKGDENTDEALLSRVLVGWSGLLDDESGAEMPFSPEARARVIESPSFCRALLNAYFRAIYPTADNTDALGDAQVKNSEPASMS